MALLAVSEGCLLGGRTNENPISKSMHSKIYIYLCIRVSYQTRPGCVLEGSTCSLCVGIPYPKQKQTQKNGSSRGYPGATVNTKCSVKSLRGAVSWKKIVSVLPRIVYKHRGQPQHIELAVSRRSASSHESSKSHCIK